MQMLFVDESGTPPPQDRVSNTPFFVLGGVSIPEEVWQKLAADLAHIKKTFGVDCEIKWRYFAPVRDGAKPNGLAHLSAAKKEELRTALYKALSGYRSIRLICVVTNVAEAYMLDYVNTPDDLYWYSYKQLTERFQYYLQDLERTVGTKTHGIIVCDHRAPKDDERLRELHHKLMTTERTITSKYANLIEGLFIAPSHLSVGIQFADMVAGAVFRVKKAKDIRFYKQIEGSFRRSPDGKLEGYGIVKFPRGEW